MQPFVPSGVCLRFVKISSPNLDKAPKTCQCIKNRCDCSPVIRDQIEIMIMVMMRS